MGTERGGSGNVGASFNMLGREGKEEYRIGPEREAGRSH